MEHYVCRPKVYWTGIQSAFTASPEDALSREALARKCTEVYGNEGVDAGKGDDLVFTLFDCRGHEHEFRPGHDEQWQKIAPDTVLIYIRPMKADEKA
jgi:hypothetical protein